PPTPLLAPRSPQTAATAPRRAPPRRASRPAPPRPAPDRAHPAETVPLRQRPDADRAQLAALREHVAARPSPGWLRRSLTGRRRRTGTVVLGLVAAAATLQVISGAETARRQWERTGPVPVATRTLEAGTVISDEDFQIIEMPALAVADETPAA